MINRNDLCWCASNKKWKKCCYPTPPPPSFEERKRSYKKKYQIEIKTEEEINSIREASEVAATILECLKEAAVAGVTTRELDQYSRKLHKLAGATAACLHYGMPPFPATICTSLNDVICHGIPDNKPLKDGDILNIDVTSILNGFYGDCSLMVSINTPNKEKHLLIEAAKECLRRSIAILKPGVLIQDIGEVICSYAETQGFSVVHQFVAHGVGTAFHEEPQIPHSRNTNKIPFVEGMTFTIEPMINAGTAEGNVDKKDSWTARTNDGKPSAQFEHTLVITATGCEILTLPNRNKYHFPSLKEALLS